MARILLVDDDPSTLDVITFTFSLEGHQTLTAENGQQAIDVARRDRPDLIVIDSMMPVMDGMTATRILRETPELCHVPIIMLTAKAMDADIWAGWQAGVSSYITKPLDVCVLIAEMERIGLGGSSRELVEA